MSIFLQHPDEALSTVATLLLRLANVDCTTLWQEAHQHRLEINWERNHPASDGKWVFFFWSCHFFFGSGRLFLEKRSWQKLVPTEFPGMSWGNLLADMNHFFPGLFVIDMTHPVSMIRSIGKCPSGADRHCRHGLRGGIHFTGFSRCVLVREMLEEADVQVVQPLNGELGVIQELLQGFIHPRINKKEHKVEQSQIKNCWIPRLSRHFSKQNPFCACQAMEFPLSTAGCGRWRTTLSCSQQPGLRKETKRKMAVGQKRIYNKTQLIMGKRKNKQNLRFF